MSVLASLTEYVLPNVNSPAGEFTIKMYCADATLTVPTIQTLLNIGELEENVDVAPSIQESSILTIEIADDTTVHSQGFWYKALSAECYLKIMLLESGAETYFFFGMVEPLQVEWTDHYINSGSTVFVRSGVVTLASFEKKIFEATTSALQADVYSRRKIQSADAPVEDDPYTYFRVMSIFASMLYVSGINSTYDRHDVTYIYDPNKPELKYVQAGTGTKFTFDNLFFMPSVYAPDPIGYGERESFFFETGAAHTGGAARWTDTYYYLKEFITALLNSFQLILRFNYDTSDGRVKIKLYSRGHAFVDGSNVTIGTPISRDISFASDKQLSGVRAYDYSSQANGTWIAKSYSSSLIQSGEVPDYVTIDYSVPIMMQVGNGYITPITLEAARCLFGDNSVDEDLNETLEQTWTTRITSVEWLNYETDAYVATAITGLYQLCEAITGYLYHRFSPLTKSIKCIYGTLSSNNGSASQSNSICLMRTSINDGNGAKTYYAQSVKKKPSENKMEIIWLEE